MFNVSFEQKIPIASCQIQERRTGRFVPAVVYEYDCTESSDVNDIRKLKGDWKYKENILEDMKRKFIMQKTGLESSKRFFVMEKKKGNVVGICETGDEDRNINISYIETKQDKKHRYAGQALIAVIAGMVISEAKNKLIIKNPVNEALDFYIQTCKFHEAKEGKLYMNRNHINKFLARTQSRTQSPVISLNA